MNAMLNPPSSPRISLRARALKLFLRLTHRRRIYASGAARPSVRMRRQLNVQLERIGTMEVCTLQPRKPFPERPVFFYLHGGAYCRPITSHHWRFLNWLVTEHGCTAIVPLYPLAPESQCTATLQALRGVHALMCERHGPFDAFIGDSAGAGLCLALCQELRASNQALPNRLVLITPFVDASLSDPAVNETALRDPMLAIPGVHEAARLYAGELGASHPLVSPLQADLHQLPAMQIFAATDDILHHDALAFAKKAGDSGCAVELHVEAGMIHVWPLLPLPEARRSRSAITQFLRG